MRVMCFSTQQWILTFLLPYVIHFMLFSSACNFQNVLQVCFFLVCIRCILQYVIYVHSLILDGRSSSVVFWFDIVKKGLPGE